MTDDRITVLPVLAATARSDAEWHVIHAGQEVGPLMLADLIERAVAGEIETDDLVKQTGGLWTKACEFRFLRDARADGDRQRRQQCLAFDAKEDANERAPRPVSQMPKGTVSPAAWTLFAVGGVLFGLRYGGYLFTSPLDFLLPCLFWGLILGVPAYLCYRYRKRRGITLVATLFCLTAGIHVTVAGYSRFILQPQIDKKLRDLEQKTGGVSLPNGWTKNHTAAPLEANPSNEARFYYECGNSWSEKEDHEMAIKDYDEAIRLDPQFVAAYASRGLSWCLRGEYAKAIEDCDQAIRLDPKHAPAYLNRGVASCCKKDYDRAIRDFDEVSRLDPKNVCVYEDRGNAWHAKKDYTKAIKDFGEAIRLDPRNASAYHGRGLSLLAKGDYYNALRDFDEAIRLDQRFAFYYSHRAQAWKASKDYDRAIKDYDEAIRIDPNDALSYGCRGTAWQDKNDFDKAIRDYDEAIRLDPYNASYYSCRGSAWYAKKEYNKAKQDFDTATRLDPANFPAVKR
jgi:tetratricopeptide (TPR) repeat protein